MQLVNERADNSRYDEALEEYAEENSISKAKFIKHQLKPFDNII